MNILEHYALTSGTDKYEHGYCPFYHKYLEHLRQSNISLLEIGVQEEHSIHMWNAYFPNADIHGIDIRFQRRTARATYHLLNVELQEFEEYTKTCQEWDVIIDDGGHTMKQQQLALKLLWPKVKSGGIFIMEDLHTSSEYYRKTHNPNNDITTFELIEALRDKRESFCSTFISNEEYAAILNDVSTVEVWSKQPGIIADSTTSVIIKA